MTSNNNNNNNNIEKFIKNMPKVELHLHLEGSLDPSLLLKLAKRNDMLHTLPYQTIEECHDAYNFTNLQSFLDLYYANMKVLQNECDFYDLTYDYLTKVQTQNVKHVEVFFDPQAHTQRGITFDTVINGIHTALMDGRRNLGISSKLIMCFLRHLPEEDAMETLDMALKHKDKIVGVGLDSTELGNPPEKFSTVFEKAIAEGFVTVAHAGEEGPPSYITSALDTLHVSRIDHGIRCLESPELVQRLIKDKIPLTICPLSNVKLRVVKTMNDHPMKQLLDLGVCVTVNSDDPAYFGGYVTENYLALIEASELGITKEDVVTMGRNGIESTFLKRDEKQKLLDELEAYVQQDDAGW